MPKLKFTARGIDAIQPPQSGQVDYWDAGLPGFILRVSYSGRKTWCVSYRQDDGTRPRLKLGTYPTLTLADAREKASDALRDVAHGKDPAQEKAARRVAPTVRDLASVYVKEHASGKRSGDRDKKILDRDVLPEIGNMKAGEVRRGDVKRLLQKIVERPAPVLANRVHEVLRKAFNFALDEEDEYGFGVDHNPCLRIKRQVEHSRTRWLTLKEIKALWKALDNESADSAGALRLLFLTGQRQQNVLAMRWADVEDGLWSIPASETKTGDAYEVPLSGPAIWILSGLRGGDDTWVFPMRDKDAPAGRTFIAKPFASAIKRAGIEDFRMHDARHTIATHLGHMGLSEWIIGKVLHHGKPSTTAKYVHATYRREKAAALEAWGVRVLEAVYGKPAAGKVVKLREAS